MRGLLHQAGTGFGRIPSIAINGLHSDMTRENGERKRPCHRPHRFLGRFAMVVYRAKCYFCQINVIKTVFRATPDKKGQHLKSGVNPLPPFVPSHSQDMRGACLCGAYRANGVRRGRMSADTAQDKTWGLSFAGGGCRQRHLPSCCFKGAVKSGKSHGKGFFSQSVFALPQ